ncbi:MAG: helix-turn-helix transcriptional regulator [Lachnospiraceae bacterium]|nr:helix-turn-helix transcriptional regulator [Lachnospiraceae bacterium]
MPQEKVSSGRESRVYVEKQIRVPGFSMSYEHAHEYYEFFYLKAGSCRYKTKDRLYQLEAGNMFIVHPGDRHSTSYQGKVPCERIVVYFKRELLDEGWWNSHAETDSFMCSSCKLSFSIKGKAVIERTLRAMLSENNMPDGYTSEILILYMKQLLIDLVRRGTVMNDYVRSNDSFGRDIEAVIRYISENYSKPITLEEAASSINLAPTYFSRKFKSVTGSTFREFVIGIRIRQATQMLLTTDDSVTEISQKCGFNSGNYFKDCFRRTVGQSPTQFRKHKGKA